LLCPLRLTGECMYWMLVQTPRPFFRPASRTWAARRAARAAGRKTKMDMTRRLWETLHKALDYFDSAEIDDEDEAAEEQARLEEAEDWLERNRPE